jgi:hypothetical protein
LGLFVAIAVRALAGAYRDQGGGALLPVVLALIVFSWPAYQLLAFLRPLDPNQLCRAMYGAGPFPEAVVLGEYLRKHTEPGDRIGILGSEPEVLFYAQRRGATGHIYMYPLAERHRLAHNFQQQMIKDLEVTQPEYVLFYSFPSSWFNGPKGDISGLLTWGNQWLKEHYEIVGVVEIQDVDLSIYRWGNDAARYNPRDALRWIRIFKRRDNT